MNDIVKGIERQVNRTKEDTEAITLPFPRSLEDELQLDSRRPPTMVLRKIMYDWLEKYLKPTAGKTCNPRENNIWLQKFGTEISRNPTIKPTSSVLPMMFSKLQTSTLLKVCKVHNTGSTANRINNSARSRALYAKNRDRIRLYSEL